MSDKNQNKGFPKAFQDRLIQQKFPKEKPIFWGPNQKTRYPNEYEEPKNWKLQEYLKIPIVIRFITGGDSVPAPLSLGRRIYLGYTDTNDCKILYLTANPTWGYQTPFEKYGSLSGSVTVYQDFQKVNEVEDLYSANMTTEAIINQAAYTQKHIVPATLITVGKTYAGKVSGVYAYSDGPFTGRLESGSQYIPNAGGLSVPDGVIPIGALDGYETIDTEGLTINDAGWRGDEVGHVANANKLWQIQVRGFTIYWFLFNQITNTISNQKNFLFAVPHVPEQFPGSLHWNDILGLQQIYQNLGFNRAIIDGLILQLG